jgi:hypothetical protein
VLFRSEMLQKEFALVLVWTWLDSQILELNQQCMPQDWLEFIPGKTQS